MADFIISPWRCALGDLGSIAGLCIPPPIYSSYNCSMGVDYQRRNLGEPRSEPFEPRNRLCLGIQLRSDNWGSHGPIPQNRASIRYIYLCFYCLTWANLRTDFICYLWDRPNNPNRGCFYLFVFFEAHSERCFQVFFRKAHPHL